jgi:hypothetical protein
MAENKSKTEKFSEILSSLDECMKLVPASVVEVAVLQRYGGDSWKERMLEIRQRLIVIRGLLSDAEIKLNT